MVSWISSECEDNFCSYVNNLKLTSESISEFYQKSMQGLYRSALRI